MGQPEIRRQYFIFINEILPFYLTARQICRTAVKNRIYADCTTAMAGIFFIAVVITIPNWLIVLLKKKIVK